MWTYTGLLLCFTSLLTGAFCISVNNGRYEDINIIIQDSVTENETLLSRIKEIFTNASQLLFQATKQQVYFGKISIIVPKDWTYKSEYTVIPARSELDTYITVEEGRIKRPHTKPKRRKCGEHMRYIYLPTGFLLTEGKTKWGHHANVLVHEWGHYRWGLYDEYATKKNRRFYMKDGIWKPSRCSESISGKVGRGSQCSKRLSTCDTSDTEKKLHTNCKFCPDEMQNGDDFGSIMAYNWVDGVSMFCDNPDNESVPIHQRHNRDVTNKHNLKCNHRSAWEVMRDHDDFKTAPLNVSTNTTPEFRILQEGNCYRVFVLDVSGSMAGSRIDTLYKSSKYNIEALIPEDSWLGIVWFQSSVTHIKELTQVTSQKIRNELIAELPTSASGRTCIGCGIEAALTMLHGLLDDPAGSAIIVISDGNNNVGDLDTSIQMAIDDQVIIHTLSISQNSDKRLVSMATATGGVPITYLETPTISFGSAFMELFACGLTSYASESTTLLSEKLDTLLSTEAYFTFDIDSSVGNYTTIGVLLGTSIDINIEIEIVGPEGDVQAEKTNGKSIVFVLPGTAVAGQYNAVVKTSTPTTFEYYVTSLPTDPEVVRVSSLVSPITLDFSTGELPEIYADVTKGRAPVIGANVTAVVEIGSISCNVTLLDNGADPDDFDNDGTYSAVIPRSCLSNGRIATKVYVRCENGTAFVLNVGSLDSDEDSNNKEAIENNVQRVTVSNGIVMTNVVDQDIIAPGRITDVDIVDIVTEHTQYGENRNFTITWTATGDDVNIGQAIEYELRISNDQSALFNNFSATDPLDVVNTNFTPKAAGVTEAIRIAVDAEDSYVSTAYFGVRAKDDAGNVGPVSNIVSLVVANGFRIKVEADVTVVYAFTDDSVEEAVIEEEKRERLTMLAIGLSSAAALIVIAITAVTCCVKKLKAKEIVEDSEFNNRTSITTVSTIDKLPMDFFANVAPRQTIAKKSFQSSQLPTNPEREQTWALSFTSRPGSAISYPKKPFDIVSQGECSIEFLNDKDETLSEQMDEYMDEDEDNLSQQFSRLGTSNDCNKVMAMKLNKDMVTHKLLEGVSPNFSPTQDDAEKNKEIVQDGHLNTTEKHEGPAIDNGTKKNHKRGYRNDIFEESPKTYSSLSLELPVIDNDGLHEELKKYYSEIC